MASGPKYRKDTVLQELGGGVTRRVLSYNDALMLVEVSFEKGAVGAVHTHYHNQETYVISGKFCFSIGEEEFVVSAGDTLGFESNVPHGTVCLEAGALLDIFAPMREDFL